MKKKDTQLTIRLTTKQKETIERNARNKGLNNSTYIINKCFNSRKGAYRTKKDKETINAVVEVQKNLNDLERIAPNCGYYSEELIRIINEMRKVENIIWRNSLL